MPKSTVGRCATSICKHFKWNDFWFLTCEKWIYCGYALLVICTVVLVLLFFFSKLFEVFNSIYFVKTYCFLTYPQKRNELSGDSVCVLSLHTLVKEG